MEKNRSEEYDDFSNEEKLELAKELERRAFKLRCEVAGSDVDGNDSKPRFGLN